MTPSPIFVTSWIPPAAEWGNNSAAEASAMPVLLYGYDPVGLKNSVLEIDAGGALKVTSAASTATGASINGTAAASGIIKPANANSSQVIIQNVDAAETLYLSFNNPATVDDIAILPGGSITYNSGVANAIYGLGSGAGAKYSIQELSA